VGELETEARRSRAEVAAFLVDLADQLDADGEVTLELDGTAVALDPADPVTMKLEGESDWATGETEAKQSIEIELVWRRPADSPEAAALDVRRS
jgi:amphi-Trp domain-containing protein